MKFDLGNREFYWFNEICKIPHGSRNEKALSDYIVAFAKDHGLECKQDDVWNVIVRKSASIGKENSSPLIIQGHIDMVCEKILGSKHDFLTDPLDLYEEDGLLKAKDTTLGADDGLGAAWMLALLEDDTIVHPPLVCIFTVMEEVGLLGASNLKREDINADRLITVDCVDEAVADLCSAGGCYGRTEATLRMEKNIDSTYELHVDGLLGGHSGADIHRERGNANILTAGILEGAVSSGLSIKLVSFNGGEKENAIPRNASIIFTSSSTEEEIKKSIQQAYEDLYQEYKESDIGFHYSLRKIDKSDMHADDHTTKSILDYVFLMPNGFQHRSMKVDGLTATSLNLGVIKTEGNKVVMTILIRSMIDAAVRHLNQQLKLLANQVGLVYTAGEFYPGWNYSEISPMRDKFAEACKMNGKTLRVKAEHGGLEAGVFAGLHPGIDIITVGADCRYYHTSEEELDIASFHHAYLILKDIVRLSAED